MIEVTLSYPNGAQKLVLLAGVPRVGECIRLDRENPNEPSLRVEYVAWLEAAGAEQAPSVLLKVRSSEAPS